MAYPGFMLALVVGVAVGSFIYYCFAQETPHAYGNNGYSTRNDGPRAITSNTASRGNSSSCQRRRRRRLSSCELCSICQEPLAGDTQELKCEDKFHSACIKLWLAQRRICPNCRCTV